MWRINKLGKIPYRTRVDLTSSPTKKTKKKPVFKKKIAMEPEPSTPPVNAKHEIPSPINDALLASHVGGDEAPSLSSSMKPERTSTNMGKAQGNCPQSPPRRRGRLNPLLLYLS